MSTELQSVGNNTGSASAGTITATLGSNVTAGSLLVAAISYDLGPGTTTISSVADGLGNNYTLISEVRDTTQGQGAALYYCRQALAGASTTTVTFSTSAAYRRVIVVEFSTTTDSPDTFNFQPRTATTTTTDATVCAVHTPTANALIVAFCEVHASNPTCTLAPGTGYTEADETAVNSPALCEVEWRDKTGGGSETSTWTLTAGAASNYVAISAAFKSATVEKQSFYTSRRRTVSR